MNKAIVLIAALLLAVLVLMDLMDILGREEFWDLEGNAIIDCGSLLCGAELKPRCCK